MNILIKLMSIVSLVIAPSLAQVASHDPASSMGATPQFHQPATQGTFQTGPGGATAPMEGEDLNADDEYRSLITQLEQDGLFTVETNSITVSGGKIWIDGNALNADKAKKYEPLVNEITRVQNAIRVNTRK